MKYYTGNDHISLINVERNLSINGLTTLCMGLNGNIFLDCSIKLRLYDNDGEIDLNKGDFELVNYWIPRVRVRSKGQEIVTTLLAPKGVRGFMYDIQGENVRAELEITYKNFFININTPHKLDPQVKTYFQHYFKHGVLSFTLGGFILGLSACGSKDAGIEASGGVIKIKEQATGGKMNFYLGLGCEEMASSSACVEFQRRGFDKYRSELSKWLEVRVRGFKDKAIERIYNTNLFFAYFFGYGKTIDTEELVAVTSRSPEYYVSGAYWDRDTLLWSFPSVLMIDKDRAREILEYVFRVQGKNFGAHSRYINGSTLEYGFELDELCAPFIALESYVKAAGDRKFLKKEYIAEALEDADKKFAAWKDERYCVYKTELKPSDDMIKYEFNTYDNMLVWKAFGALAYLHKVMGKPGVSKHFLNLALKLRKNVKRFAVHNGLFAYEFDLAGNHLLYEEPAGSLRLLEYYGFIDESMKKINENTIKWIYSKDNEYFREDSLIKESGCGHAPHPWALSAANSLLTLGYEKYGVDFFKNAVMDNYYAAESVNADTGVAETGRAFATCAGFIAYAISLGYKE